MEFYEYSKQLVANETPLDPVEVDEKIREIAFDMVKHEYCLLFNPDLRQYVFFHNKETACPRTFAKELSETLLNRGQILLVDNEKGVWEIWIKDIYDGKFYLYQLHDYTDSVIEVN